jgi:hypothetical protein
MTDPAITIRRGERLYGPYSPEQITEMLNTGSVVLDDEAWSESDGQWTTLSHILAAGPNPSGHGRDTLDSLLGNPTESGSLPYAQEADSGMEDCIANVLMAVGLIAIGLGSFTIVKHMDATAKVRQEQDSTQTPASHSP